LPFDRGTVEQALFEPLPGRLIRMLSAAMTLELHVSRLKGDLAGDTPEERFQSFVKRMQVREHAVGFLAEYPVLARRIVEAIEQWETYSLEFIRHLCADYDSIRERFSPDADLGSFTGVVTELGDTHRGGRSVQIAQFSSGLRIVYKPRDLEVDVHFHELLAWLNERGDHPPFRTHAILNRGSHGWVEFVTHEGCTSSEEVLRFYRRQGGYLALLYALEATDFHHENLIAAGEHPVLIDLECLFQPRPKCDGIATAMRVSDEALSQSVLRVGLLPDRSWADDQSDGVDTSALGSVAGQEYPEPVPFWEDAGTDAMRLARKRMVMTESRNRPTLDGEAANPLAYSGEIEAGFTEIYRLLQAHRDCLLSPEGVLRRFDRDEIRVLLRGTHDYATMLRESFHPDLVRDALDRDRFFDHLWGEAARRSELVAAFRAERDDLLRGDIPLLNSRPGSQALWNCDNELIADHFHEPAMAGVDRRVRALSDEDLTRQLWFIRASLSTLSRFEDRLARSNPGFGAVGPGTEAGGDSFLAAARAVGDRLVSSAFRDDQEATWIGLVNPFHERQLLVRPLGLILYDGQPGVLLFLAYLGALTGEARYTSLAESALVSLRRMVDGGRSTLKTIGYAAGWGGIIYTYGHLAALWERPDLLTEAEELVDLLPPLIDQDDKLDLIVGAAGCIGSLIGLYRTSPKARTLELAVRCGDHILTRALTMDQGIAWDAPTPTRTPLTGFAHGAAGIAWALGELADLTGESRFHTAERSAIAYERGLFSPEAKNWPDLRDHGGKGLSQHHDQPSFTVAWCHGAPGIGLARILSLNRLDSVETRAEIDAALETTLARGFGDNHSLCHGDLGNAETLLQAGEKLADPRWRAEAGRMGTATLESIRRKGWICGVPTGVETPGLMQGLAGIGFGLLRLADPRRTPSVLALEPPIKRALRSLPPVRELERVPRTPRSGYHTIHRIGTSHEDK
jgi:type 2 lantibiotic biosynthesis protein LanM